MFRHLLIALILVLIFVSPTQAASFPPVDEAQVAEIANAWFDPPVGTPRLDMLPTVISMSIAAGVDPNFTIAIWLHETAASNYYGICHVFGNDDPNASYCQKAQDFGINDPAIETKYTPDGTITEDHFMDQLSVFLGLPDAYAATCGCDDMYSFFARYRSGANGPACAPTCGDIAYYESIKEIYGWLTGNPDLFPKYPKPELAQECNHNFNLDNCGVTPSNALGHPLRPNPGEAQPVKDEKAYLTTYCAMRPAPVQINRIDLRGKPNGRGGRDAVADLKTVGNLTQDFTKFVTPLLSITDATKGDYSLPFNDKAQRYLADFLDGRAYYEPEAEPELVGADLPTLNDIFNRTGVFRKLAPHSYQNELKKAMIYRAVGVPVSQNPKSINPYGPGLPASEKIHNYVVASWDEKNHQVVDQGKGKPVTLGEFFSNRAWAPLEEDYPSRILYQQAYDAWVKKDSGKWFKLWPYVPMFSREDTLGKMEIIDSNPPPQPWSPPGSTAIEINKSNKTEVEISHPHLARAYEVSTVLSYLLIPEKNKFAERPQLKDEWQPKLWELSNWWLDPSYMKPHPPKVPQEDVILGPVCDVDPNYTSPISSSGDNALDDIIGTQVNREDRNVSFEFLGLEQSPPIDPIACVDDQGNTSYLNYECEQCLSGHKDESKCFVNKAVRSSPDYLLTYTPFLSQILTSTTLSGRGIFDIFRAYDPATDSAKKLDQKYGWPGLGSEGEDSPKYSFSNGRAEAGAFKAGDSQSYYYRFLGTVQCAKERTMQVLQPFITGEEYQPYAAACFNLGENAPKPPPAGLACSQEKGPVDINYSVDSPIATRAKNIVADLYQGFWCYWNRSPGDFNTDVTDHPPSYPKLFNEVLFKENPNADPSGGDDLFWCTWLVTKAFNETGHTMPTNLLYTPDMANWFLGQQSQEPPFGRRYLDNEAPQHPNPEITYEDILPGDAIFFRIPEDYYRLDHVAIVYSVNEDGITTVESNAGYKTMFYPADETGHFQTINIEGDTIKVAGFGKQL